VDEFVEQMKKKAQQAGGAQPPSPEMISAQADIEVAKTDQQTAQIKAGAEQQKAQIGLLDTITEHTTTMKEKAADLEIAKAQPRQPNGGPPA